MNLFRVIREIRGLICILIFNITVTCPEPCFSGVEGKDEELPGTTEPNEV